MRRSLAIASAAAVACVAAGTPLRAQGSAVMTHGSCALALGGAGVADPCDDGSAILFNPAALAETPSLVTVGVSGITAGGDFTYNNTGERIEREEGTTPVPFAYANYRFSERLAAGIGLFAPYGLGLDWPACTVEEINSNSCTGPNFEGRFVSYDTKLTNIYIQPTVAFRAAPWLSVGAGADYVMAEIDINQRLDLAEQPLPLPGVPAGTTFGNVGVRSGTDFADAHLNGTGNGLGFHLGAQARVAPWLSVGARYLSEVEIEYEGDADFTRINTGVVLPNGTQADPLLTAQFADGQALSNQTVTTGLTLPQQVVVGVALTPMERLRVVADYQWTGWSSFDQAPLNFERLTDQTLVLDYQNTDTWRVGAEFGATDALALRAGFIYNTAAEREFSVSPLLPEAERNYYSLGLGYRFGRALGLDVGYQLVDQADRSGRVRGRTPTMTEAELRARNVGVYGSTAHVLNVTFSYRFDGR
jgi:long-chain fatty acid transport protein